MKLTQEQTEQIQTQTGLQPIPGDVAEQSGLNAHFGEDTFYFSNDGIFVFEEDGTTDTEADEDFNMLTAIKIAAIEKEEGKNEIAVMEVERQETALTVDMNP